MFGFQKTVQFSDMNNINKEVYELAVLSGCPLHECKNALVVCKEKATAFYYLKLTNEAVVRYKTSNENKKWTQQDYIDEAKRLAQHRRP